MKKDTSIEEPTLGARDSQHVEEGEGEDRQRIRSLALSSRFDPQVRKTTEVELVKVPDNQTFFRIAKGDHWRVPAVGVVEIKSGDKFGGEIYLVTEDYIDSVGLNVAIATLCAGQYTTGQMFLWPVKIESANGNTCDWHTSAQRVASLAEDKWVRMYSGKSKYLWAVAPDGVHPEPKWPQGKDIFDLAVNATRDRLIDRHDHEVLRRLRGEI